MLDDMNELNEVWAGMLESAIAKAEAENRSDVADYLKLKAANDAVRQTGVQWLFGSLLEIAGNNLQITIENETPHRFAFQNASLVGSLLRLRYGLRCLTIEAGWTRTPADGFMRSGALAAASITHFGMAKQNAELLLLRANGLPNWYAAEKDGSRSFFDTNRLNRHYQIFLGAS
jgi:hypothetical protein